MGRSGSRRVKVGRCAAIAVVVVTSLLGVDPVAAGAAPSSGTVSGNGNGEARATPTADWPMVGRGPGHAGFNPGERTIGVGNVARLTTRWTAETWFGGDPAVVANGVAYLGSGGGRLYAFDARGSTGCSGAPRRCTPLWTATTGSPQGGLVRTPAVQNGLVYVTAIDGSTARDVLYAFDAAGVRGCSGRPKVCRPRFSAVLGEVGSSSAPTVVASGVVYVATDTANRKVMAFDAKGLEGCSSTTRRCKPLWTARLGSLTRGAYGAVAAADGLVYAIAGEGDVMAFDAAGKKGCSGVPKTCAPVWRASDTGAQWALSAPVVADGVLYLVSLYGVVSAYDARGASGCAGTPKVCAPLWTATVDHDSASSVAVAEGTVFVTSMSKARVGRISALDAKGVSGCSGTPKVCRALWTGRTVDPPSTAESPTVANGVVYLTTVQGRIQAFDARGSARCSGRPRTCAALWTKWTPGGYASSATIANGRVYLSNEKTFYAFGLP